MRDTVGTRPPSLSGHAQVHNIMTTRKSHRAAQHKHSAAQRTTTHAHTHHDPARQASALWPQAGLVRSRRDRTSGSAWQNFLDPWSGQARMCQPYERPIPPFPRLAFGLLGSLRNGELKIPSKRSRVALRHRPHNGA